MPRRYSEEEAQRIFAHVAERQRDALAADAGLSIEDLQEAARAAGLDPDLVLQAAVSLDAPAPERSQTLLGAPVEVVRQRMIPEPVSDETWAQIVAEARRAFGGVGIAGQIGRLREWTLVSSKASNQNITTRLALEPTPEGTRLTLSRNVRDMALGFTIAGAVNAGMAVLFWVLFALGVQAEFAIPALILTLLAIGFGGGSQVGLRLWETSQANTFTSFLDRAELVVRAAEDGAVASSPPAPTRERTSTLPLDLDAVGDAPGAAGRAGASRQRS